MLGTVKPLERGNRNCTEILYDQQFFVSCMASVYEVVRVACQSRRQTKYATDRRRLIRAR